MEAKYIETEFGKCSTIEGGECDGLNPANNPELCYLTHKDRKYWGLMEFYELGKAYANSPICPLAIYYQFFRELMFTIKNNGCYGILYDKRSPAFFKSSPAGPGGLIPVLLNSVPDKLKPLIKTMHIQDVVDALETFGYPWTIDSREKYGIKKNQI